MLNTLRTRFTLILVGLAIGPLLVAGIVLVQRSVTLEQARAIALQDQVAQNVATEVGAYFQGVATDLNNIGNEIRNLAKPDRAQQLGIMLNALNSGVYRDVYEELALLDAQGKESVRLLRSDIVSSSELINRSLADEFTVPVSSREIYFSPVFFDEESDAPYVTVALPLFRPRSIELSGVLVAKIRFALVGALIADSKVGADQTLYITDLEGNLVAHQDRAFNLMDSKIDPPGEAGRQRGLDGTSVILASQEFNLGGQSFRLIAEKPASIALELASTTITTIATIIVISLIVALFFGFLAVRQIVQPIEGLARTAEVIASGDFSHEASAPRNDEIGTLANAFNSMTTQLRGLIGSLEQRVEQRTSELELTSRQSEKRAQELQTIAEVARFISTEKDMVKLLPLVTRSVSERFGFYHVGIFLLDEIGKHAVLRASNSSGGQEMLRRQHRLEVGQTGIVGNVTATGIPRIALETGTDAIYFNNPSLPDTRSEMALPLRARGSIIGALDVQSTEPNAFTDADVSILGLLADQIAIAIDNARLIEETQQLLAESQAVFNEYIAESWRKRTGSGILGYHQSVSGGIIITDQTSPIGNEEYSNSGKSFEVPIRVRDQVIGLLNIKSISNDKPLNSDDINAVQAVAERLGLALDNARLFEETSTRASRERLVTEITTRIRRSNNPQEMIRTAVEELQRALGATRVEIVPNQASRPPDNST